MKFSAQQKAALDLVEDWICNDNQVFRLFGYAGTGKTTIAKEINASHYAAFTGKAAHMLREKGCVGATTIHSLIYNPRGKSMERLRTLEDKRVADMMDPVLEIEIAKEIRNLQQPSFTLNLESPLRSALLLVIDECSMVDARMAKDLLGFGCKVLVLGDPAQLPPVGGGGYFTKAEPDFLLTEIHRQAHGNPILELANKIRTHKSWHNTDMVVGHIEPEAALEYDQIICGTNKLRRAINHRVRELLGYADELPVPGDKVVCLRNNHLLGLMNGALYDVMACEQSEIGVLRLLLDGGHDILVHEAPFIGKDVDPWLRKNYDEFDYGYALTCHKSQGSQWDSVLVFDESRVFRGNENRWLYTAVTRAAKTLKVVI